MRSISAVVSLEVYLDRTKDQSGGGQVETVKGETYLRGPYKKYRNKVVVRGDCGTKGEA